MIPFSGTVETFMPTWKADLSDPTPTAYDDNSVGYWLRVGDMVWFTVTFRFNSSGVSSSDVGDGDYYWVPALDGAPPIDPALYALTAWPMLCGRANVGNEFNNNTLDSQGTCEIEAFSTRIYGQVSSLFRDRVGPRSPSSFEEDGRFQITGKYPTLSTLLS